MRYFAYIAEQSFKTAPGGERLFYLNGPWSRPYIIPDAETERHLFKKQLWLLRIMLGGLILGMPVPLVVFEIPDHPLTFFIFLAAVMAIFWVVPRIVYREDLKDLSPGPRLSIHMFYREMAEKHSYTMLALGLSVCLLFVACGIWTLHVGTVPAAIAILLIAFFAVVTLTWCYALYLKCTNAPQ